MKDRDKPRWCRKNAEQDFRIYYRLCTGGMLATLASGMLHVLAGDIAHAALMSAFFVIFGALQWPQAFQYANQREAFAVARYHARRAN